MASDDLFSEDAGASDPLASGVMGADADAMASDPMGSGMEAQQPLGPTQPRTQKPRSNVYTMMLILSLAAIVTSCIVLYLYLAQFGDYPWWEPPASVTNAL